MDGTEESTLRAKYLDWCSARLAERFLDLSPEEIYALARPGEGPPPEPNALAATADPTASPDSTEPADAVEPPAPKGAVTRASTEEVASGDSRTPSQPSLPQPTDEGYRTLVQRVTEALLRRTSLPTFEQWAEAYADSPERFEAELLGFWKDVVGED